MHRDWSCLQEKPILSPSCYLENHMKGPCLPFFLWAWCRGTIEGFRLFLDPTDLADSQDNCCISLRVLESSSPFASIWMSEWQWWKGGGSYPPPQQHSRVIRNPAVLCKQAGFTVHILVKETDEIPLPHPLSLYNLYNSSAQWPCQ